ncbi:hypothetical protein CF319_g1906 [Tilletia indica]|nr:hypothetical protein CF319_g1906 [Tilletia indica]
MAGAKSRARKGGQRSTQAPTGGKKNNTVIPDADRFEEVLDQEEEDGNDGRKVAGGSRGASASARGVEGLQAWHEDEGSELEEEEEQQQQHRRTAGRPELDYGEQYGYDSASASEEDDPLDPRITQEDLSALPPELRARTAALLAEAQREEGLSPVAELAFDTIIWTIPLVFVYVLLDVLVRQQYSQPVYLGGELKRICTRGPFLGLLSFYSLKHRESPWLRYGFFGLSLGAGAGFLYVTAKSDFESILRQTPALGALWVLSIVKLDLIPGLVSLGLVGAFVWALDLDLFNG